MSKPRNITFECSIGSNIQKLREQKGMTRKHLAKQSRLSESVIRSIESDIEVEELPKVILKIADGLRTSILAILGRPIKDPKMIKLWNQIYDLSSRLRNKGYLKG